ncbi:MAG: alanine--tRNA ligase [Lachnospiraceae bacterium]|nr:alanine--tRNA ligase [Lachnospiraceae bacterium]
MEWTGLNELREKYLSFFESKEHLRLKSFPLVPKDDNSLLLINSGMAPMKKYFTGEITPPRKRVTTCQKCIRTPDIERVGITARHGTYFEMLGNFSFGDYFKEEATTWAWEFFTEVLKMPKEKLYVSIYEKDDQAFDIWTKNRGVDPSHMVRLGKEDNFWEHGSGPCGPCSEIYFDRGPEKGCGKPTCAVGCDCDRYVEVWNLVFTQFDSDGKGSYTPLDHPNIDTGMGLERLACVMQGVDNLFLVDTVQNIMKHICEITGVKYGEDDKKDISLRVITDHIRSTTFMIGDGVMPSNEGRGYVLRRLLRRAARHGRILGVTRPFLYEVCKTVIKENESAYPELREKEEFITKLIKFEEENFAKTIDQGMTLLKNIIESSEAKVISGEDAFKLNDTYGFPIDLTKEIAAESGIDVDEERFKELLQEQKKRARDARKNAGADAWISDATDLSGVEKTEFLGYTMLSNEAKVAAIVKDGNRTQAAYEGDEAIIILDKTAFYAESGGQVGDTGIIGNADFSADVTNTTKDHNGIIFHASRITKGMVSVGDTVKADVNSNNREAIMRNHTAAHLLQAALREVLGTHVQQAGQLVTDDKLRFDFTHFSAMTQDELKTVENLVNEKIFSAIEVSSKEMPIEEARKLGAMALFGEKYGDVVRVVSVDDFSIEFCGGTHVDNTSKLGMFHIRSEASAAAGVRRIEAVTGKGVLDYLTNSVATIFAAADKLKIANPWDLVQGCEKIADSLKEKDRKIDELYNKLAAGMVSGILASEKTENGVSIFTGVLNEVSSDMLRGICDKITDKYTSCAVVLAGKNDGKGTFAVSCTKEAVKKGIKAGAVAKAVAQLTGGNGGGKPEMAMAGAKDITKIDDAVSKAYEIIAGMIQ